MSGSFPGNYVSKILEVVSHIMVKCNKLADPILIILSNMQIRSNDTSISIFLFLFPCAQFVFFRIFNNPEARPIALWPETESLSIKNWSKVYKISMKYLTYGNSKMYGFRILYSHSFLNWNLMMSFTRLAPSHLGSWRWGSTRTGVT